MEDVKFAVCRDILHKQETAMEIRKKDGVQLKESNLRFCRLMSRESRDWRLRKSPSSRTSIGSTVAQPPALIIQKVYNFNFGGAARSGYTAVTPSRFGGSRRDGGSAGILSLSFYSLPSLVFDWKFLLWKQENLVKDKLSPLDKNVGRH